VLQGTQQSLMANGNVIGCGVTSRSAVGSTKRWPTVTDSNIFFLNQQRSKWAVLVWNALKAESGFWFGHRRVASTFNVLQRNAVEIAGVPAAILKSCEIAAEHLNPAWQAGSHAG